MNEAPETPEDKLEKVFAGEKINWKTFRKKKVPFDLKYCDQLIQHFNKGIGVWVENGMSSGRFRANALPHFSAFARSIGVAEDDMTEWASIFPEWKAAMKMAEDMRNEILKDNSLLGNYDSGVAKLFLGHYAGIKEKVEPPAPTTINIGFAQGFDRYLQQRGEQPVLLPNIQDAEFVEEVIDPVPAPAPPKVSDMGKEFKEFRAKRQKS